MKRKKSLITFGVAVLSIALLLIVRENASTADLECPECNIILISVDTFRADHLGCYGYGKNTTPYIDEFSKDAVLFENAIAQAPSTEPSHASILTSLIPLHHGAFYARNTSLSDDKVTMAEILRDNGYLTVSYNGGGQISREFGFAQGFDIYESNAGYDFEDVSSYAMDWISKNKDEKFFIFLHTYETHHPYTPSESYLGLMEQGGYSGNLGSNITKELLMKINRGTIQITEEDRQHIINTYDAEIRSMDESFPALIEYLKNEGLYDNTIIIVTSDHGEEFGEHGKVGWHSHTLYEELLQVPLIIKLPGSLLASTRIEGMVRSIDILPTVLDILDIPPEKNFEGLSLVESMLNRKAEMRPAVSQQGLKAYSIRTDRWKLYGPKLYDLESDPEEKEDVSGHNNDLTRSLTKTLDEILKSRPAAVGTQAKPDNETLEQLKALGYVE